MLPVNEDRASLAMRMVDETVIDADVYVMACGPWLPQLFPAAIGGRIRPTQQEVLYFGVPPGATGYAAPRLPVWIDFAAGLYGIPDLDAHGFKVGIDRHGPPIDPDTIDRVVAPDVIARTRDWLAHRFPGLAAAPLVDSRVCQYENTSTGDFIIDRHPAWPNVWIVGGGSGHGFKHGPAVARHVADLIAGRAAPEPRFALASKTSEHRRTIY
jgi:glycine/D-amino acid oxidase-like deaminating enzyme